MVDRRQPADLGDRPRIGGPQLDLDPMHVDDLTLPRSRHKPLALEGDLVVVRRVARWPGTRRPSSPTEPLEGRQVVAEAADARRFVHALAACRDGRGAVLS